MPRWHHSDSSSERYQEVKSIKTFYAAHISRSQAKSMFGNWTIILSFCMNGFLFLQEYLQNIFLEKRKSERHKTFLTGTVKDKAKLKHQGYGPIDDDNQVLE